MRHLPSPPIPATFQLGSGAALAAITGIDVVSDFRSADIAVGGEGAPLVPLFDFQFLRSDDADRLIVNIGGIANVTWLPAHAEANAVIAFDTGPGNMLLDFITQKYFDRPYDENGKLARSGRIDRELLDELLSHPFFKSRPPKSTGHELFSEKFLDRITHSIASGKILPVDALATLTEFTACSIMQSFEFLQSKSDKLEIIISGGGTFNMFLLERLSANAPAPMAIKTSDAFGIPSKAKEAIAFAFFTRAFIEEIPIHLPTTTGATKRVSLGSLSRGK